MTAARVVFRAEALRDLQEIADHIGSFDQAAANRVVARIHRTIFRTLAILPKAGRLNRDTGAREFPVPGLPYLIIFLSNADLVDVVGVFHTARDPQSKRKP